MTFRQDEVENFLSFFKKAKPKINAFQGCESVELYRDQGLSNVFYTHSIWIDQEHLEDYRSSDFFKKTWAETKLLFAEKPQAYSLVRP